MFSLVLVLLVPLFVLGGHGVAAVAVAGGGGHNSGHGGGHELFRLVHKVIVIVIGPQPSPHP